MKRQVKPPRLDLVVDAGTLITMDPKRPEVESRHLIAIRDGQIVSMDRWTKSTAASLNKRAKRWLDYSQHLVMPGLVNGHMHMPMSLLRGLAEDKPFQIWLHETILPIESKMVSPAFVKLGTELAALECIRTGTTTVCDMYYFEPAIADAIDRAGLRGLVAPAIAGFPTPDDLEQKQVAFDVAKQLSKKYKHHSRLRVGLGPHAPYTVSDALFRASAETAKTLDIPLHIHVSETLEENQTSLKQHGKSPVARLHALGVTGPKTIFAHGVVLSDDDIALIAKSGTSIIHNPESNMKLSCGSAPIGKLLQAGVKVGLGTDGAASNNNLNLFEEMGSAAKLHRLSKHAEPLTSRDVLRMATLGGAHALGLGHETGSLEIGKRADLIALETEHAHLYPRHDWMSHLVYSASGMEVAATICDGKILFEKGRYQTLNSQSIYKAAEGVRRKIEGLLKR